MSVSKWPIAAIRDGWHPTQETLIPHFEWQHTHEKRTSILANQLALPANTRRSAKFG